MAELYDCPVCKNQISTKSLFCPKCGHIDSMDRNPFRMSGFTLLFVLIVWTIIMPFIVGALWITVLQGLGS